MRDPHAIWYWNSMQQVNYRPDELPYGEWMKILKESREESDRLREQRIKAIHEAVDALTEKKRKVKKEEGPRTYSEQEIIDEIEGSKS